MYYWFPYPYQSTFRSLRNRCYMKQKINHRGKARTTETQASPRAFHLKPDHIQADTVET